MSSAMTIMESVNNKAATAASGKVAAEISDALPGDYFSLLKPRVMSLVVFTALVGLVMAPANISPIIAAIAILCIAIGAGASGALNMWYDADIDAVMGRTAKRPVPSGRIKAGEALGFGLAMSFFSVFAMAFMVNYFSAAFLAFTIFFYAVIYTIWLKRSTPQNIVIGGAAGAFPPMIGWAAVTGGVSIESFVLFAIIFIWTPPHFWSLAIFKSADYERAGIPMMPNVRGMASTQLQIFVYSLAVAPVGVLPWVLGMAGPVYGVASVVLGVVFVWLAWQVKTMDTADETMKPAKRLFSFSIFYLFALFAMMLIEAIVMKFIA